MVEEDAFIATGVSAVDDNGVYLSRFGLEEVNIQRPVVRRLAVVGLNATLLPGVDIGEGAMVAGGSVVTRSVAPWTMVAGVPARYFRDIPADWKEKVLGRKPRRS
jgi:acetyltransferase-like isoleucine patch superfamily enzyme